MQIHKLQRSIVVRSAILLLCGLGLQAGPVTYTYSGATFDSYIQNGGTGSNGDLVLISNQNDVIGSVTLNAALQNTSAQTDYTGHVISWSLTVEGAFTKSSASGNSLQNLSFGTTNGVITSWDVFSEDGSPVGGQPAEWQGEGAGVSTALSQRRTLVAPPYPPRTATSGFGQVPPRPAPVLPSNNLSTWFSYLAGLAKMFIIVIPGLLFPVLLLNCGHTRCLSPGVTESGNYHQRCHTGKTRIRPLESLCSDFCYHQPETQT
jgi:hypothetical protein